MQQSRFFQIFREEILRGLVFAMSFFAFLSIGFASIAYAAADGGEFGRMLNKILVNAWNDPTNDGTVKNSEKLGGKLPEAFISVPIGGFSCIGANKCIKGIEYDGTPRCDTP